MWSALRLFGPSVVRDGVLMLGSICCLRVFEACVWPVCGPCLLVICLILVWSSTAKLGLCLPAYACTPSLASVFTSEFGPNTFRARLSQLAHIPDPGAQGLYLRRYQPQRPSPAPPLPRPFPPPPRPRPRSRRCRQWVTLIQQITVPGDQPCPGGGTRSPGLPIVRNT